MLTANLSTLTPHSSLVFEEDNSTDSENGTSDEIDGEKKEPVKTIIEVDNTQKTKGATASEIQSKLLSVHTLCIIVALQQLIMLFICLHAG